MESSKSIKEKLALGYSHLRSANFAIQGTLLPLVNLLATGKKRETPQGYANHLKLALPKIQELLKQDAVNISENIYPLEVLQPENPLRHGLRIPFLFVDAFLSARRREEKESKSFDATATELLTELPDYYQRNFHFQTNGYLGESSASLYDHQVEVLFSGSADPMRRLIIPPIKRHFEFSDGAGLRFLEIGCGTGRLTKFMALAFPKAQITCVDLSPFYLKEAQRHLRQFQRIDYVQGRGEELAFKSDSFDFVFSSFVFHELPHDVRKKMMLEAYRLLKPSGIFGIVDSIQLNDDSELNWALEQFPQDFHEPFYKNYSQNPLEKMMEEAQFRTIEKFQGFLSKAVTGLK